MARQFTNGTKTIDEKEYRSLTPKQQFEYSEVGKKKSELQKQAPKTSTNVSKASAVSTPDMSSDRNYNKGKDVSLEDNPKLKKAVEKRDEAQVNNDKATVDKIEQSEAFKHPVLNVDNPENAETNKQIEALQEKELPAEAKDEPADPSDAISDEAIADPTKATEEDQTNAQESLADNGFTQTTPDGKQILDKDKLMSLLAQPAQPSLLSKIFNTISALVSVATLGIVPRVDFNKVTGTTEYLQNVNKMIEDYNTNILSNYTAQVAGAQGNVEAADINASLDKDTAEKAGYNKKALEGSVAEWSKDKQFLQLQNEYAKDQKRLEADIAKEMATLSTQNNAYILKLSSDLQNKSAAEQNKYLYEFAKDTSNDPESRAVAKQMAVWTAGGNAVTPNMLGLKTASAAMDLATKPIDTAANALGAVAEAVK